MNSDDAKKPGVNYSENTTYNSEYTTKIETHLQSDQEYTKIEDNDQQEKAKNNKPLLNPDNKNNYSLMTNPKISAKYRYGIPIIITLNILLFIDANLNPGATVGGTLNLGPMQSQSAKLKQFTLVESVSDMWEAGVYPLALIIAIFSGFWPYVKLFMMMACWVINEKTMSYALREKILVVLDAAGKWSLVDAYVLILMIVGFRFNILQELLSIKFQGNIIVTPNWGFYGFFLAAIVSLVITHIIIHQHRAIVKVHVEEKKASSSLSNPKKQVKIIVGSLIFIAVVGLVVGASIDSFAFSFEGAAGWILPSDKRKVDYSMLGLGYNLPIDMAEPDSFGARYIQLIFFLLSVVFPLFFLGFLALLFLKPLTIQIQQKIFDITEIIYAWSALDVMVVSIVVALVEIKQFAAFIIGDSCDGINQIIKLVNTKNMGINIQPPICFSVVTTLDIGCIVLFCSAGLFFVLGSFTLRNIKNNMDKKIQKLYEEQIQVQNVEFLVKQPSQYQPPQQQQEQQQQKQKKELNDDQETREISSIINPDVIANEIIEV